MKTSNLQLDNYFIKAISFSHNKNFKNTEDAVIESPSLKVKCNYANAVKHSNSRECEVEISLTESSAGTFPYQFDIAMSGLFGVNPNLSSESAETLFRVNAPALLYSAAREIIFNITSHTEHQPFMLPSVSFIDEDTSDEKAAAAVPKAEKKKRTPKAAKK